MWSVSECVCVCVCMSMLAQCLLIASAFTVTSRSWKHVGFFVVSDVGIWEKPALWGSTALWTELRLEVAEASGDGWPPTPPGETWHLQWVVFVGQKGGFIHRAERTSWHKVFHYWDGFFWGKCLYSVISRKPENGLWFHSQHFDKMPQNKGYKRDFLQVRFLFPKIFKMKPVISQFFTHGPSQDGTTLEKPSKHHGPVRILYEWRHFFYRHSTYGRKSNADVQFFFLFKLLNSDKVGIENLSCLILRLLKAEFVLWDFSFARICGIDSKNVRGTITSHEEQSQSSCFGQQSLQAHTVMGVWPNRTVCWDRQSVWNACVALTVAAGR